MNTSLDAGTTSDTGTTGVPVRPGDPFVDLVYGDEELVRAEFEALIAASWDPPPPTPPARPQPAGGPPGWHTAWANGVPPMPARLLRSRTQLPRQRGPPW